MPIGTDHQLDSISSGDRLASLEVKKNAKNAKQEKLNAHAASLLGITIASSYLNPSPWTGSDPEPSPWVELRPLPLFRSGYRPSSECLGYRDESIVERYHDRRTIKRL